jgi:hypothetical protein
MQRAIEESVEAQVEEEIVAAAKRAAEWEATQKEIEEAVCIPIVCVNTGS